MKFKTIRFTARYASLACALLWGSAFAQTFPDRPVKLIVPFSAGGAADILARGLADRMTRTLQQPVVVENRPGAGALIAADHVARSPADGHTLLLAGPTNLVLHPLLNPRLTYDVQADFAGVGMVAYSPLVLVTAARSPADNFESFLKSTTARPGTMNFGSAGNGSALHIAGELVKTTTGLDLRHVPYKGSPPALNGLMSGEVQAVFDLVASAKPLVDGGRLNALAVTSATRSSVMPNVPTLNELGYKGFDFSVRYALMAPKATPAAVVKRLNADLNLALNDPTLSAQLKSLALDPTPGPAEAVTAYIQSEQAKLKPVIKANGITLDP